MEIPGNYLSKIKSVFQTTFYCILENTLKTLNFFTTSFLKYIFLQNMLIRNIFYIIAYITHMGL